MKSWAVAVTHRFSFLDRALKQNPLLESPCRYFAVTLLDFDPDRWTSQILGSAKRGAASHKWVFCGARRYVV